MPIDASGLECSLSDEASNWGRPGTREVMLMREQSALWEQHSERAGSFDGSQNTWL